MSPQNKNIVLAVVGVLIIGTIIYIEAHKPPALAPGDVQDVALTANDLGSTTLGTAQIGGSTSTSASTDSLSRAATLKAKAAKYPSAVELIPGPQAGATGIAATGFINSAPFTLKSLVGNKVVLIDFWTYSCINCQRTIPYLNAWYAKYKDYGFTIIGVHTPEFDFEKNYANVAAAVKAAGIQYPVMQDDNDATWQAYQNEYWPNEYLVDIDGYIVHNQIGEGDYDKTEEAIQAALQERANVLNTGQTIPTGLVNPANVVTVDPSQQISPETYFGAERNEYFADGVQSTTGPQTLEFPPIASMQTDSLYLDGVWDFQSQYAELTGQPVNGIAGKIDYDFNAKNVYIVGAADPAVAPNGVKVKVLIDGQPITASEMGSDVAPDGTMTIGSNNLYHIFSGSVYGSHTLELDVLNPGLQAYTFTFG